MSGNIPADESSPRTPEQHAAVRRRSLPVVLVANVLGVVALVMLFTRSVSVQVPPDIFAVNLSFCAMLMGVGILFYSKGTPGLKVARTLCLTATLISLVGPALFASQSRQWRELMVNTEKQRASNIAMAAEKFAKDHDGAYPRMLADILAGKYISEETLLSPFGGQGSQYLQEMKQSGKSAIKMDLASDYTYVGGDLHLPLSPTAAATIVVVYETDPVMRNLFAIAFADGHAELFTQDSAPAILKACNEARSRLGLPPIKNPDSLERAQTANAAP